MKWTTAFVMLSVMLTLCGCGEKEKKENVNKAAAESIITTMTTLLEETVVETSIETVVSETEESVDSVEKTVTFQQSEVDFATVLDNTMFIGDSITSGFGGYQKVAMEKVVATLNVGPSNVRDYSFDYNGNEYAALTILNFEQPENIVVSMGLNDINSYSPEEFSELYMDYVKDAMTVCDNSQFYIFSVTPVSRECGNIKNETIDAVNAKLKETVEGYGSERLHYVDCNSALKGADGYMNESFSGGDGIHLSSGAYDVILEEFRKSLAIE